MSVPTTATPAAGTDNAGTDNAATVAAIYEAFGRGDIPAVLDRLAPDVAFDADWNDHFGQRAGVPLLVPRRGRAQVAEFFAVVAEATLEHFEVHDIIGTGRQVVAEITSGFALPGGGRFLDEELHLWTFGADGLVSRFRHYVDTAKHIAAAAGEDTTTGPGSG